ncbi:tetratricopeptide repeat protein [Azospirillum sp. TSH100]|uniref:tetratricopeptide repeat protein n=1 Tax=Azospirillum sp. TSH100 TaxID=652764 RepID=UPI000D643388|nr:hypothetical protein [Azospirillum sp. TSH100]QCG90487.1 hypothetical protein E6C72_22040 [Azospirillum sp. TSH100]
MRETRSRFLRHFLQRERRREGVAFLLPGPVLRPALAVMTVLALFASAAQGEDGGADSSLDSWLVVREKPTATSRQVDTVATHTTVLPKRSEAETDWRLMPFIAAQTSGGMPGQPIPLSIVVTSPYGQPNPEHEAITHVTIDDLPADAKVSRGQRGADGVWTVQLEDLPDLTLTLPGNVAAPLTLRITAVTDHGGGVVARQAVTLAVPVSETVAAAELPETDMAPPPAQGGSSQAIEAARPETEPVGSGTSTPLPAPGEMPEQEVAATPPSIEAPVAVQEAVQVAVAPPPQPEPRQPPQQEVAVHRPAKLPSGIQEATLMKRGDDLFAQGDLAGARLYYERVAETGNAKAAFALGRTHDPLVHERLHVRGLPPDPEQAAAWYRRAVAAGSGDAEQQLKKLTDWLADKSR